MVSYSRLRPARSRADPLRCVRPAVGVPAPARVAGSVPVALMFSPYGLILGPCRHGQGVTVGRDHSRLVVAVGSWLLVPGCWFLAVSLGCPCCSDLFR